MTIDSLKLIKLSNTPLIVRKCSFLILMSLCLYSWTDEAAGTRGYTELRTLNVCDHPYAGMMITQNTTLCSGIFYLNNSGSS